MKFPRVHAAGNGINGQGFAPYIPQGEDPIELSEHDDWGLSYIIDSYYVRVNRLWFGESEGVAYEGPRISQALAVAAAEEWRKRYSLDEYHPDMKRWFYTTHRRVDGLLH